MDEDRIAAIVAAMTGDIPIGPRNPGHYVKAGGNREAGWRNSYQPYKDINGNMYVSMEVLKNGEKLETLFDYEFLDMVKNSSTWYVLEGGYVTNSTYKKYLHHLVMNFQGKGQGFQQVSIDHINRNPLDNRKANLRRATAREQQENSKGRIEGTKRERQVTAIALPETVVQSDLPMYVTYRKEPMKEYFVIECHPIQTYGITINGNIINKTVKSTQAQWVDQYADPRVLYPISKKLEEIKAKLVKLNEIYRLCKEQNVKNVTVPEDEIIKELIGLRTAKNTKTVYKYDPKYKLIATYESAVEAFKANNCSENSIRRAIKSEKLFQGFYYRTAEVINNTIDMKIDIDEEEEEEEEEEDEQ